MVAEAEAGAGAGDGVESSEGRPLKSSTPSYSLDSSIASAGIEVMENRRKRAEFGRGGGVIWADGGAELTRGQT